MDKREINSDMKKFNEKAKKNGLIDSFYSAR